MKKFLVDAIQRDRFPATAFYNNLGNAISISDNFNVGFMGGRCFFG